MKICFLAHASSIHTVRWLNYFVNKGHECYIITLTPPGDTPQGVILHYIPHGHPLSYEHSNWQYLMHIPAIWKAIRNINPDLVNAHFLSSYGLLGAITCPKRIPYVISLYGSDVLVIPERSPLHRMAARFSLSRAKLVISVSEHMTRILGKYLPVGVPVVTTQYGINTDQFHPPEQEKIRGPICMSTRAMVKISDLETLIAAARLLHDQNASFQYSLAGDGELMRQLAESVKVNGLQAVVSILGRIKSDQMPSLLHEAAVYVTTSLSDGSSLALLEAMACGAFPVATDIPANREWITHGKNGFLFRPGSPTELASFIQEAWNNPDLRSDAAKINWQIIQKRGNYQKNMDLIEKSFITLVNSSK